MGSIQLFFAFDKFRFLFCEVNKLVQGFLVHMTVLLQLLVTLIQLLEQLQYITKQ